MYQGRTGAEAGAVIETGPGITLLKKGDCIVLPFNVADGRCRNCEEGRAAFCTGVNPGFAGDAYDYVAMGPYQGRRAQYLRVPYAAFNALKLPEGKGARGIFCATGGYFPNGLAWAGAGWVQARRERGSVWSGARWVDGGV